MPVRLRQALAGALIGLFGLSLLSTSATGILGSAIYLLLAGWAVSVIRAGTTQPTERPGSDSGGTRIAAANRDAAN